MDRVYNVWIGALQQTWRLKVQLHSQKTNGTGADATESPSKVESMAMSSTQQVQHNILLCVLIKSIRAYKEVNAM